MQSSEIQQSQITDSEMNIYLNLHLSIKKLPKHKLYKSRIYYFRVYIRE